MWIIKEHNTVTRSGLAPGLSTQSPTTLIIKQLHVPLYHILIEVQNDQNLISLLLEWLYWQFPLHAEQLVSSLQIWAITNDILVKRGIVISPSSSSPKLNSITWAIFNFLLHEIIHLTVHTLLVSYFVGCYSCSSVLYWQPSHYIDCCSWLIYISYLQIS